MKTFGANSRGFSMGDFIGILFVVILGCCFLFFGIFPAMQQQPLGTPRKIQCLANLNEIHKGLAAWGMDPSDPARPPFPPTNMHSALKNMGVAPNMFICPTAAGTLNRPAGIAPATNVAQITATNCNYNYWTLRSEDDGKKVLVCDRNGVNNATNAVAGWGKNHDDLGGNFVTVAGNGRWMTTNEILKTKSAMFNLSSNETGLGVVTNN